MLHHDDHRPPHIGDAQGVAPDGYARAFAIGVALNTAFVVVEVVYGLSAGSLALLSDAGHNLSDILALLLAWGASYLARMAPTKRRTYGWRRSSILAALINAVVLLIVVGGLMVEAVARLAHPPAVTGSVMIWVAAAGVVINTGSALLFMRQGQNDLNVRGAFLHMAGDAVVSLGVVITGAAIEFTHWLWLDPAVSLAIGLAIIYGTWSLLRESLNLSMDAVPADIDIHALEAFLADIPDVVAVHDLHVWAMSTTETALTVHLVMAPPPGSDRFLHDLAHELNERFEIGHATVQIERGDDDSRCHLEPAHVV